MKEIKLKKWTRGLSTDEYRTVLDFINIYNHSMLRRNTLIHIIYNVIVKDSPSVAVTEEIRNNTSSDVYVLKWFIGLINNDKNDVSQLVGYDSHFSIVKEACYIIKRNHYDIATVTLFANIVKSFSTLCHMKSRDYLVNALEIVKNRSDDDTILEGIDSSDVGCVHLEIGTYADDIRYANLRIHTGGLVAGKPHIREYYFVEDGIEDSSRFSNILFNNISADKLSFLYTRENYCYSDLLVMDGEMMNDSKLSRDILCTHIFEFVYMIIWDEMSLPLRKSTLLQEDTEDTPTVTPMVKENGESGENSEVDNTEELSKDTAVIGAYGTDLKGVGLKDKAWFEDLKKELLDILKPTNNEMNLSLDVINGRECLSINTVEIYRLSIDLTVIKSCFDNLKLPNSVNVRLVLYRSSPDGKITPLTEVSVYVLKDVKEMFRLLLTNVKDIVNSSYSYFIGFYGLDTEDVSSRSYYVKPHILDNDGNITEESEADVVASAGIVASGVISDGDNSVDIKDTEWFCDLMKVLLDTFKPTTPLYVFAAAEQGVEGVQVNYQHNNNVCRVMITIPVITSCFNDSDFEKCGYKTLTINRVSADGMPHMYNRHTVCNSMEAKQSLSDLLLSFINDVKKPITYGTRLYVIKEGTMYEKN